MAKVEYPYCPSSLSAEERLNLCQRYLWRIMARIVGIMGRKYGQEALDAIYESLRD